MIAQQILCRISRTEGVLTQYVPGVGWHYRTKLGHLLGPFDTEAEARSARERSLTPQPDRDWTLSGRTG